MTIKTNLMLVVILFLGVSYMDFQDAVENAQYMQDDWPQLMEKYDEEDYVRNAEEAAKKEIQKQEHHLDTTMSEYSF